jgi:hypothetical protein
LSRLRRFQLQDFAAALEAMVALSVSDTCDNVLESTDCVEVLQSLISRAVSEPQSCTPEMLSALTMLVTKLIHRDVSLERLSRSWEAGCVKKILQVRSWV